jgi:hypothetical protein
MLVCCLYDAYHHSHIHTALIPDGFSQLCQILRRRLRLRRMRCMAVDLRMSWVRAAMMRRYAGSWRGLLVGCHRRCLQCRCG